jgi:CHAT domain-containing protein
MEMREVDISSQMLFDSCSVLSKNLASYFGDRGTDIDGRDDRKEVRLEIIQSRSAFLYEALLRPIENVIGDYEKVYIVPVKELSYIPFGALVNKVSDDKMKYAIEDYNIGYLSSMYLFDLIYNLNTHLSESILLMGNPDRSLPFAEVEVNEIAKLFASKKLFVEANASIKNFEGNVKGNKIIHLATHGKLVEESLKDSWLLFANGEKFDMSNAYNLPLDGTELVVLSACESGLGGKGLEYSTLARAFANAGAQSVLATLWEVNDLATQELMVRFYKYYLSGSDKFTALAKAQRDLIHSDNKELTHPSKWSPFIIIGKP